MRITIIITCFLVSTLSSNAQDTSIMSISTAGIVIGHTQLIDYNKNQEKEHYKIHSNTKAFGFYQVEYMLETWFTHEVLDSSLAYYKINGRTKHQCQIWHNDSLFYISRDGSEISTIAKPSQDSYCRIFFKKNHPPNTLYSEYDGEIKLINYINDSTFQIINKENKIEANYVLNDSTIARGHINHVLLKFTLTKK